MVVAGDEVGGFPPETLQFLRGIEGNNSKSWFDANRDLYEAGYVEPAKRFVEIVGPRLVTIFADSALRPQDQRLDRPHQS